MWMPTCCGFSGKADVVGEGTDKSTQQIHRDADPDIQGKTCGITSGRIISQQGQATTCKDLLTRGTVGCRSEMICRMSS